MFYYKKSLGQNFLKAHRALELVDIANISGRVIVEIGPGNGSITKHLSMAKELILVEKDDRFISELDRLFPSAITINSDFLELSLDSIKRSEKLTVISNLPFNVAAPIIERLIKNRDLFSEAYLVVQREVAERIVSQDKKSCFSFLVQTFSQPKIERFISSSDFHPKPKVDAAYLSLKFNSREYSVDLIKFVKEIFMNKRKQIINNLSKVVGSREIALSILDRLGIDKSIRVERLPNEDIERLAIEKRKYDSFRE